jgi:hypothetical protein
MAAQDEPVEPVHGRAYGVFLVSGLLINHDKPTKKLVFDQETLP